MVLMAMTVWAVLVASPGWSKGLTYPAVRTKTPQKLELVMGKSVVLESAVPIKRASLANPEVADAIILSDRQVFVIGKTVGVTSLTLWEKKRGQVFSVFSLVVTPDLSRLKGQLNRVLPEEKAIKVMASHENLTLWGTVSGASQLSQALALAEAFAPKKVTNLLTVEGIHQVMIKVIVAEMNRELLRRLGVNIAAVNSRGTSFGVTKINDLAPIVPFEDALLGPLPPTAFSPFGLGLSAATNALFRFTTGEWTVNTFLDALKENSLVKILAEPTLMALSGKEASFLAGGEFPYPVPQSFNVTTIKFKEFGVGLVFKPTVLSTNRISLEINPEVSELDFSNAVQIAGFTIPSITTRRVSTSIEVDDGQSFVIAGLIKDNIREQISKFPLLGDIPILGALFRSSQYQKNETELIILVTVHLVKPLDKANQPLPTDKFLDPNDFEFYLDGQTEGAPKIAKANNTKNSKDSVRLSRGPVMNLTKGGLDGEFGYLLP